MFFLYCVEYDPKLLQYKDEFIRNSILHLVICHILVYLITKENVFIDQQN